MTDPLWQIAMRLPTVHWAGCYCAHCEESLPDDVVIMNGEAFHETCAAIYVKDGLDDLGNGIAAVCGGA